jgi:hypothetical protein
MLIPYDKASINDINVGAISALEPILLDPRSFRAFYCGVERRCHSGVIFRINTGQPPKRICFTLIITVSEERGGTFAPGHAARLQVKVPDDVLRSFGCKFPQFLRVRS